MGLPDDCKVNLRAKFPKGKKNLITDVSGVKVGHVTLKDEDKNIHTGVTAILPHGGESIPAESNGWNLRHQRVRKECGTAAD